MAAAYLGMDLNVKVLVACFVNIDCNFKECLIKTLSVNHQRYSDANVILVIFYVEQKIKKYHFNCYHNKMMKIYGEYFLK